MRPIQLAPLAFSLAAASLCHLPPASADEGEARYFKGNTHTHSLWSDGNDFPEMIGDWYRERGYNFLVLSDHNTLSRGERWMKVADVEKRKKAIGKPVLDKYLAKFGEDWVELRGEAAAREVRLRTLDEIRAKLEKPGEFMFIEGEEITDRFENREVHTNAINLAEAIKPRHGASVREVMRNNLLAVREQAEKLGRPIIAHLNHPNFRWSLTAEDIAHVLEEEFFEVYNGHPGINHEGDAARGVPGDEAIWDLANTLRLSSLGGQPLRAVATDDSHTYHGGDIRPGRGWIMVRAEKLEPDAIVEAMRAGDFYASTGVTLKRVAFDKGTRQLAVDIEPAEGAVFTTQIIGTRKGDEGDPAKIGAVLATVEGTEVRYTMAGDEWYIRATVTSSQAHADPSFTGQKKQAWTQPIW